MIKPDCNQRGEDEMGGLQIRPVILPNAGDFIPGHTHNFDHVTFLAQGSVHVDATCEDNCHEEQVIQGPAYFLIKRDWTHKITAMSDNVHFWCIFPSYDAKGRRTGASI